MTQKIERPIIFNSEMVRAFLEGLKTQTRRPIQLNERIGDFVDLCIPRDNGFWENAKDSFGALFKAPKEEWIAQDKPFHVFCRCPFGQPGDRLWVRETWSKAIDLQKHTRIVYRADEPFKEWREKWQPSIHMSRWASRITLEITDVRVERVQEIRDQDARLEGWKAEEAGCAPYCWFRKKWDSIYSKGPYSWAVNPWVWVIEFKQV